MQAAHLSLAGCIVGVVPEASALAQAVEEGMLQIAACCRLRCRCESARFGAGDCGGCRSVSSPCRFWRLHRSAPKRQDVRADGRRRSSPSRAPRKSEPCSCRREHRSARSRSRKRRPAYAKFPTYESLASQARCGRARSRLLM